MDPTLQRLASLAVPRIGDWCSIDLVGEDGGLRNVAVAHTDPDEVALAEELQRRYPPDPDAATGAANVVRTGESELFPSIPDELIAEAAVDEEHLRMIRELGMVSAMIVPLTARDRNLGAMTLVAAESGRHYGEDDLSLSQELARHAALAVDNAMLYRREHEAALTLQRALLPQRIPAPKTTEVAVRYLPAGPGVEVGGDWYDVVETDLGRIGVVIGDVAGRGLKAATIMGNLRTALRAYIADGHEPAAAVERLNVAHGRLRPSRRWQRSPTSRSIRSPVASSTCERGIRRPCCAIRPAPCPPRSGRARRRAGSGRARRGIAVGLARLREALAAAPDDAERCAEEIIQTLGAGSSPTTRHWSR